MNNRNYHQPYRSFKEPHYGIFIHLTFLLFILSSLIIHIGCQQGNSVSPPNTSYETVTFDTKDQITLSGRVFGPVEGNPVILLTHSNTETQDSWNPFVDLLSAQGHTVMTFNSRGTPPSEGRQNENQFDTDIHGALSWLQSRGVRGLVIIGSGEGATAAIKFASIQSVVGVIALSPQMNLGELSMSSILSEIDNSILFIVSEEDESARKAASDMFHAPHKGVWAISIFRGEANGTELVNPNLNEDVPEHVIQYLEDFFQ